jgi:hypothetical protein
MHSPSYTLVWALILHAQMRLNTERSAMGTLFFSPFLTITRNRTLTKLIRCRSVMGTGNILMLCHILASFILPHYCTLTYTRTPSAHTFILAHKKNKVGMSFSETPVVPGESFCDKSVMGTGNVLISDTSQDPNFVNSRFVLGPPYIKFYFSVGLVLDQEV